MLTRKINAGVSLIITILVLCHAIFLAVWMLSRGGVSKPGNELPWILTGLTAIHALLSICFMVSTHKGSSSHKGAAYPKMIIATMIQRISGILMVVFTGLHIAGATKAMQPPKVVHAIVPPLFFVVVLVHVAVSTCKAFITLGVGNARTVKMTNIVIKVICILTAIADLVGFYLYVC